MRPDIQELERLCPGIPLPFIEAHCFRLDEEYFLCFSTDEIAGHIRKLYAITPSRPVDIDIKQHETGELELTVYAFDYPFEFSLLAGTFSSMGFDIQSGDIFTYHRTSGAAESASPVERKATASTPSGQRRMIIDRFFGRRVTEEDFELWVEELRQRLAIVFSLLEQQDLASLQEAKQRVNEWVTERLAEVPPASLPTLYPVHIEILNNSPESTELRVTAQDTPAFLYSLSTALSLHGVSIERVRIRTIHGRIEDTLFFTDANGLPITDPQILNQIKLSALFTKQFTYFLDKAPDPFVALSRFEHLVQEISQLPQSSRWLEWISNPRAMQDLARLLGASDYLWEDFVRLQYESLLPLLEPHVKDHAIVQPVETLEQRLDRELAGVEDFEELKRRVNQFKDRELFVIDVDHIVSGAQDFEAFAARLTALAEVVVRRSVAIVYEALQRRYGKPRTVAGLETAYAVFGLGKLGGGDLGYASDIELLFIFSDHGETDGPERIQNAEFFSLLAQETSRFIAAKREGIFHIDLRLRPHGESGPLASSLEAFCRYYGPGGTAHSYEKLALVRLRFIAGDRMLGEQVERLRDEFIYEAPHALQLAELQHIRQRQLSEKLRHGKFNAKFSPGALVDLEYTIQVLQVLHAHKNPALRTPKVQSALDALKATGVLDEQKHRELVGAYRFLRRLINGLRMLRGSARDLLLPNPDSEEFVHLARRMGYVRGPSLTQAQQLYVDFETHTAAVRSFAERLWGMSTLTQIEEGNVADLLLTANPPMRLVEYVFRKAGFQDVQRAQRNLRSLAGPEQVREEFVRLAVLAFDILRHQPDPDMALNNWERFASVLSDRYVHFREMLSQPKRLELLLSIFSRSQYLADRLILHPEWLTWVTSPEVVRRSSSRAALSQIFHQEVADEHDDETWLLAFNRFRQKQLLRIGTRDMCLRVPLPDILTDLTVMAETMLEAAVSRARRRTAEDVRRKVGGGFVDAHIRFCVLALGKLGGKELNYSSDVDLLAVYAPAHGAEELSHEMATRIMERTIALLSTHTTEGHAFRVDLRLRPFGTSGELVYTIPALYRYYAEDAALWEIQALLKMRPVAGDLDLGGELIRQITPLILQPRDPQKVSQYIRELRDIASDLARARSAQRNVKTGVGGIRDIEFLVQGLQLIHAPRYPEILQASTLNALQALANVGLLPYEVADKLTDHYIFLRRVEHYLQILEDRQIHTLPTEPRELETLARRIYGPRTTRDDFVSELEHRLTEVREFFLRYLSSNST